MMHLSPNMKQVVIRAHARMEDKGGIQLESLLQTITSELRSTKENNYGWRPDTGMFWDWGYWFGLNDDLVREPLKKMNPTLREMIDFYKHPRLTTLGDRPFQTLFLRSEWDKYGLTESAARDIERSVKRTMGKFGYSLLIDTMNFIMTGKRDISIPLIISYMDHAIDGGGVVVSERFDRKELSELPEQEFLSKWLSSKNGMHDCIEMHRLVYQIEC